MVTGTHILFGEDDVLLADDYVSSLLSCMKRTGADLVGGRIFYAERGETTGETIERCNDIRGENLMNRWMMSAHYSKATSEPRNMPFLHAISLGKASVCKKVRFDEAFFAREETDFYLRACSQGYNVFYCPDTFCVHLTRDKERGGGWRVGVLKYQILASRNNNMLVDRHFGILKKWGMKGSRATFKILHAINRLRIIYLYHDSSLRHRRIRIAFLMHGDRNIGGGEQSILLLILNMDKSLFEPILFYSSENDIVKQIRSEGIKTGKLPFDPAITSVYRDQVSRNPLFLLKYVYYLLAGVLLSVIYVNRYKIDILHPHDNLSKIIGGLGGFLSKVKLVTHCRDQLSGSRLDRSLGLWQMLVMDRIIAVSRRVATILPRSKTGFRSKVRVVYNGVDLSRFLRTDGDSTPKRRELVLKSNKVVLGIIGVFDQVKGHLLLFDALQLLKKENGIDFQCLVVGSGREEELLRDRVREMGLTNEVSFLGFRKGIPDLMEHIDIVVIPSKREACPRVAIESMAMQVPVVATSVGGLPELIQNGRTGLLVPAGDSAALAKAICYLAENPGIRREMGKEGRKRAERYFSLGNNVKMTERIYLEVMRKKNGQAGRRLGRAH